MNSQRSRTKRGMWIAAAAASLFAACEMDTDRVASDESIPLGETLSVTGEDLASIVSNPNFATPAATNACRRVTVSSIPVYSTPTSSTVNCRFQSGDVFLWIISDSAGGLRYLTWCPRHAAFDQGIFSWAQSAGTLSAPCG